MSSEEHWNTVYERTVTERLGWHEALPSTLALVTDHSTPGDSVIDAGGGDSRLVDELLDRGYGDVTVLDLSAVALERAGNRVGSHDRAVTWIQTDVTAFAPDRTWDLWHDRAVFHFFVTEHERDAYRAVASRAVAPHGLLIVAAFSTEGPEQCAGLPVCRYDLDTLPAAFSPEFELVTADRIAPGPAEDGDQRPYLGAVLRKV
jgi:ubiquinone/menaquinone biosynthesis C-methylase UbiE